MKITDPGYVLPVVQPLTLEKVLNEGATRPLLVDGVCSATNTTDRYVLKCVAGKEMTVKKSLFELVGAWMAAELGFEVVEPVLIEVDHHFVDQEKGHPEHQHLAKSIGLNFGCKFRPGFQQVVAPITSVPAMLYLQAQEVFGFDQFISNIDRSKKPEQKPNLLSNGKTFLLLDHEKAFSFIDLLAFLRNPNPWVIGMSERDMLRGHIFYDCLRQKRYEFSVFCQRLQCFDQNFWNLVRNHAPAHWQSDTIDEIETFLNLIVINHADFSDALTNELSL